MRTSSPFSLAQRRDRERDRREHDHRDRRLDRHRARLPTRRLVKGFVIHVRLVALLVLAPTARCEAYSGLLAGLEVPERGQQRGQRDDQAKPTRTAVRHGHAEERDRDRRLTHGHALAEPNPLAAKVRYANFIASTGIAQGCLRWVHDRAGFNRRHDGSQNLAPQRTAGTRTSSICVRNFARRTLSSSSCVGHCIDLGAAVIDADHRPKDEGARCRSLFS